MSTMRRKVVVVGDSGCGKTCLLTTFCNGTPPEVHIPTVFETYVADVTLDDIQVELALWDIAGQEHYDHLRALSYQNSHVILICFAINSPDSFNNVQDKWVPEIKHFHPKLPIILVGCKDNLRHDEEVIKELKDLNQKPVSWEEGLALSHEIGAKYYVECSSKSSKDVDKVFECATRAALVDSPRTNKHLCIVM